MKMTLEDQRQKWEYKLIPHLVVTRNQGKQVLVLLEEEGPGDATMSSTDFSLHRYYTMGQSPKDHWEVTPELQRASLRKCLLELNCLTMEDYPLKSPLPPVVEVVKQPLHQPPYHAPAPARVTDEWNTGVPPEPLSGFHPLEDHPGPNAPGAAGLQPLPPPLSSDRLKLHELRHRIEKDMDLIKFAINGDERVAVSIMKCDGTYRLYQYTGLQPDSWTYSLILQDATMSKARHHGSKITGLQL